MAKSAAVASAAQRGMSVAAGIIAVSLNIHAAAGLVAERTIRTPHAVTANARALSVPKFTAAHAEIRVAPMRSVVVANACAFALIAARLTLRDGSAARVQMTGPCARTRLVHRRATRSTVGDASTGALATSRALRAPAGAFQGTSGAAELSGASMKNKSAAVVVIAQVGTGAVTNPIASACPPALDPPAAGARPPATCSTE